MGVGEDGSVAIHAHVWGDRNGRLNCGWNFNCDKWEVLDEEVRETGEIMTWLGSVDGIWSEIVLSYEENTWGKGGDACNV